MKVALVHDYLSQDGGAERVLKALHEIWPGAPIFVLFYDKKKITYFGDAQVRESWLKYLPFIKDIFQWYLPLMPMATEQHDLRGYDLVISSSSVFAKGVITSTNTLHISYCHTPPRFLWGDGNNYLSDLKSGRLFKWLLPAINHHLRLWDDVSTKRVDCFIANSETVAKRIKKYYRRDSDVVFPPVETTRFETASKLGDYYVCGGRLVPYKRLDLVVKVFNRLGWPLKIFGVGPEYKHLKKIAKNNIEFYGKISEREKTVLLSRALAFIHPQKEDFGITPVEAMSAGRPVIAFNEGGATETVIPGITGVFFAEQEWESLLKILLDFDPYKWDSEKTKEHVQKFSVNNFKNAIQKLVTEKYENFKV